MKKISILLAVLILLTALPHTFAESGYITKVCLYGSTEENAQLVEFGAGMYLDNAGYRDFETKISGHKVLVTINHSKKIDYGELLGMLYEKSHLRFRDYEGNTILFNQFVTVKVHTDSHGSSGVWLTLDDVMRKKLFDATEKIATYGEGKNFIEISLNDVVLSAPVFTEPFDSNEIVAANYISREAAEKLAGLINAAKTGHIAGGEGVVNMKKENVMSDWAVAETGRAQELGLIEEGREYNFTAPITREEFCEIAYEVIEPAPAAGENRFEDTENEKIAALASLGIVEGKTQNTFAPNDSITREEAAAILDRAYRTLGLDIALAEYMPEDMTYSFSDDAEIADFAKEAVYSMYTCCIVNGVGEDLFAPKESYTTEQAIATLLRLYQHKYIAESKAEAEERGQNFILGIKITR